jgi:SAM-dependent methyltransferase
MTLRFHEIAESRHRILNPLSADKLSLIGRICTAAGPTRILDLCCGKAEMLCTWAAVHDVSGIGVDISEVFLAAAHQRAVELGVDERVTLVHADATDYVTEVAEQFDLVSCIGATWIGNGLVGTLKLMRPTVKPGGLIAVGEPCWIDPLPPGLSVLGIADEDSESLAGTHERCQNAGFDLVEMVLANTDDRIPMPSMHGSEPASAAISASTVAISAGECSCSAASAESLPDLTTDDRGSIDRGTTTKGSRQCALIGWLLVRLPLLLRPSSSVVATTT